MYTIVNLQYIKASIFWVRCSHFFRCTCRYHSDVVNIGAHIVPSLHVTQWQSEPRTDWLQSSAVLWAACLDWPVCSGWCRCAPSAAGRWASWSRLCRGCRSAASAWDSSLRWSRWWRTLYLRTRLTRGRKRKRTHQTVLNRTLHLYLICGDTRDSSGTIIFLYDNWMCKYNQSIKMLHLFSSIQQHQNKIIKPLNQYFM